MARKNSWDKKLIYFNGYLAIVFLIIFIVAGAFAFIKQNEGIAIILFILAFAIFSGFRVIQPNYALVSTFFGSYSGILNQSGLYWIIPLYSTEKVSLRTANYVTPTLKVNDSTGNPIEIAAAIVYHVENPAAAVLDIEDVYEFIRVQCESALRLLASHHAYNSTTGECLSRHSENILVQFQQMVQERVDFAGIHIEEARFTHLAYAAEIAQVMLRRQQAESVVAARETLVQGAISMVENTLQELESRQIVKMSDQEKAHLVTSMMTVLLSEESAAPVLNVGGN